MYTDVIDMTGGIACLHHLRSRKLVALFYAERTKLTRLAVQITRDAFDAEDAVQSAFLRAYEKAPDLSTQQLRAWLRTVVRRVAIDIVRSRALTDVNPVDDASLPAQLFEPAPRWSELSTEDLLDAAERCPDVVRVAFELWRGGLSYGEISCRLNIPVATVATRIFRAKTRIRKHFAIGLQSE